MPNIEAIKSEVERMREVSASSSDTCTTATYIAVRDEQVQKHLIRSFENGNMFTGVTCLDRPRIPGYELVLFGFRCPDGVFCLVNPSILIVVDVTAGRVVSIQDPYVPHLAVAEAGAVQAAPVPSLYPELVGRLSRYYRTGDSITKDLIHDRVNIVTDAERRVVRIWFG